MTWLRRAQLWICFNTFSTHTSTWLIPTYERPVQKCFLLQVFGVGFTSIFVLRVSELCEVLYIFKLIFTVAESDDNIRTHLTCFSQFKLKQYFRSVENACGLYSKAVTQIPFSLNKLTLLTFKQGQKDTGAPHEKKKNTLQVLLRSPTCEGIAGKNVWFLIYYSNALKEHVAAICWTQTKRPSTFFFIETNTHLTVHLFNHQR